MTEGFERGKAMLALVGAGCRAVALSAEADPARGRAVLIKHEFPRRWRLRPRCYCGSVRRYG